MIMSFLYKPTALSEINRDIGQIFFASLFIGPFLTNTISWPTVTMGLVLSLIFWSIGLLLAKT